MAFDLKGASVELYVKVGGNFVSFESLAGVGTHYVNRVKVKVGLLSIVNIEVSLSPPIEQAFAILKTGALGMGVSATVKTNQGDQASSNSLSDGLANVANSQIDVNMIGIRIHYGGMKSPVFKGILTQPDIEIGSEGIDITLKAVGLLFDTSQTYSEASFPDGTSRLSIIQSVVGSQYQLDIKPDATKRLSATVNGNNYKKNNLDTVRQLLMEVDCVFYVAGSSSFDNAKGPSSGPVLERMVIQSIDEMRDIKNIGASVYFYRQINPNLRQFPGLELSAPLQNLLLPGGAFSGFKVNKIDKHGKKVVPMTAGADSYAQKVTSKGTGGDNSMAGAPVQGRQLSSGPTAGTSDPSNAQRTFPVQPSRGGDSVIDKIQGAVHQFLNTAFEYSVNTIGIPDLLPGKMVDIGVADIKNLSGAYDLYSIEHSITESGYESRLELKRMGGWVAASSLGIRKLTAKAGQILGVGGTKQSTSNNLIPGG